MGNGPSDDDLRRHQLVVEQAKATASALSPFVEGNRLNPEVLKVVLDRHAPGNEADEDGIYAQPWLATDTFYRFTEEYVPLEHRLAFKMDLERTFPGRKQ